MWDIRASISIDFDWRYKTSNVFGTSSMWISQGTAVGAGAAGPMMLGSQSVNCFAIVFSFLWYRVGIIPAAAISFVTAVIVCSIPTVLLLTWLRKKNPELAESEAELERMLPLDEELLDVSSTTAACKQL